MDVLVPLIAALVFGGVGLAICWAALKSLRDRERKEARSLRAEGTVVEMRTDHTGWETNFKYPLVLFRTAEGTEVQFEASIRQDPPRHKVGDRVPVFYDPESPGTADIVGTDETALWLVVVLLGAPALLAGIGILLKCVLFGSCPVE